MPDTSKVEVLFYKSSGAIFCLQGVGATLQIRFGDLLCKRLTCMTDRKANHFFLFMQATRCISFVGQPRVEQVMDDLLYHAFTFDPSKSLLQK